jgi:hypothetical protein
MTRRSRPRPCAWPARAAARKPRRCSWASAPSYSTAGNRPGSWPKSAAKEVARDPEVRALRARLKRAEQELDILAHLCPADPVSVYQHIAQRRPRSRCGGSAACWAWPRVPTMPGSTGRWHRNRPGRWPCAQAFARHSRRYGTCRLQAEVVRRRLRAGALAHPPHAGPVRLAGPAAALVRAAHHRFGPRCTGCAQPLARSAGPHRPDRVWVGDIT